MEAVHIGRKVDADSLAMRAVKTYDHYMNKTGSKTDHSPQEPRKAKPQRKRASEVVSASNDNPTLYSNGATRLPRLGAEAPNNRHRPSAALSLAKAIDLADAVEHAEIIGLHLTKFITIHFATAGLPDAIRPQEAVGKFLKMASQWLRLRGHPFAFVWVLERVTSIREHVHIMCSCPHALAAEFNVKARGAWMTKAGMLTAKQARKRAKALNRDSEGIVIERIGPRGYHPATAHWQSTYSNQVTGLLQYHLKGIDPEQVPANDAGRVLIRTSGGKVITIEPEYQGTIFGRRCSRSENIGPKARQAYAAIQKAA
jgi:hypothetical protein